MIEMNGGGNTNIFYLPRDGEAVVVATNGIVDKYGNAVMGAGQALEAKNLFPRIDMILGSGLMKYGNHVLFLGFYTIGGHTISVYSFPTKNHWKDKSDIELIRRSASELQKIADAGSFFTCYLPLVGCGYGGLMWKDVKPILEGELNDSFIVVNNN